MSSDLVEAPSTTIRGADVAPNIPPMTEAELSRRWPPVAVTGEAEGRVTAESLVVITRWIGSLRPRNRRISAPSILRRRTWRP